MNFLVQKTILSLAALFFFKKKQNL